MSLKQLSTELLLLIASYLSQVDLLNVSLTSKRLHVATEPELYREYHPPSLERRPLSLFIRALLRSPRRLQYVRSLQLPKWEILDVYEGELDFLSDAPPETKNINDKRLYVSCTGDWSPEKARFQTLSSEDYTLFTGAAVAAGYARKIPPYEACGLVPIGVEKQYDVYRSLYFAWYYVSDTKLKGLDDDGRFCHLLKAGVDDAFVVLLLSILQNLERISLHGFSELRNALQWTKALHGHSKLRQFAAIPDAYWGYVWSPISFWADILVLPGLELFETRGCASGWVAGGEILRTCAVFSDPSNIQRLILERCALDHADLKLLLESCRNLRCFQYSTNGWLRELTDAPTSAQIVDFLAPFQMSLRELFLSKDSRSYRPMAHPLDQFEDQPIHSLAQFKGLQQLWMPTHMWANFPGPWEGPHDPTQTSTFAGILPPCLKEFKIFDSHAYPVLTQMVIDDLLEVVDRELPELISVEVESRPNSGTEGFDIREEQREIHRDSGATFSYSFRRSHSLDLPITPDEMEMHRRHGVESTRWDNDHYTTMPWHSLQAPNLLSKEEAEKKEQEDMATLLSSLEDAPTCNEEIWELQEDWLTAIGTALRYVQDA